MADGLGQTSFPKGPGENGPWRVDAVVLPCSAGTMQIRRPAELDPLLDAATGDPEQNLPYWAEIWPSGVALAAAIHRDPNALRGKRVVELGCGLGVTAIAALQAGADLLATDYAAEALALCAFNCLDQAGREPRTVQMNWRNPSGALRKTAGEGFPIVLAADVLYEARDVDPLLGLIDWLVAPGGELWLAEPGRPPAQRFLDALREWGWAGDEERCAGPWPDPADNQKGVVVGVHRMRRESRMGSGGR